MLATTVHRGVEDLRGHAPLPQFACVRTVVQTALPLLGMRCSPDPEQFENTTLLFEARRQDPEGFQRKLQEIEAIFGSEELAIQVELLEEHTRKQQQAASKDRATKTPGWALTIKPKWCKKILNGAKTWEIKGQNCKRHLHERICIAESGSGMLVGEMTISESRKISRQDLEDNVHLHGIEDLSIIAYTNIYAWVLEDVKKYEEPVPYRGTGGVGWVRLGPTPEDALCKNPECCFGLTKQNVRGKAYRNTKDDRNFEYCVFCSADAFQAALREHHGARTIRRYLDRLARANASNHQKALQCIEDVHGASALQQLNPKLQQQRQQAPKATWKSSLAYRQPALHATDTAERAFESTKQREKKRLQRKFPSLYGEEAREDSSWMPRRAAAFQTWCLEDSWRMCSCCGRMVPQPFTAKHATGKGAQSSEIAACGHCKSGGTTGYWAPSPVDVPRRLRKLSPEAVEALRPLDIHVGGEWRVPNGYLIHNDMMRFSFKTTSVEDNIAKLPRRQRERAEKALEYLLQDDSSYYACFWELHHRNLRRRARAIDRGEIWFGTPAKRMPSNFIETVGIECALWPHLYWCVEMTETYVRSQDARRLRRRQRQQEEDSEEDMDAIDPYPERATRQSAKASYLAKAHSALIGYGSDPMLLHFVYDLWLFTTIGGAKNSAGTGTVREALSTKPYSPELWRTYHTALVDLQRQIGWPSLFITIAPYEWSFPYHQWLQDELTKSLLARLEMPVAETLHLAHVLTQAVKGLLTGANEGMKPKREHIFSSCEGSGRVRHWVARLEFQDGKRKRHVHRDGQFYHGRGAVHVHILLWLSDMQAMDLAAKIRADVPGENEPEMRDLVVGSQLDYTSSGWPRREEPTEVAEEEQRLRLHHPQEAFEQRCRAYLPDVLAALRCHVDVQASDGRAMVLKYCASALFAIMLSKIAASAQISNQCTPACQGYLPKFSSSFAKEMLNNEASDFSLARRVLADYHPLQPEMIMQLAMQQQPQFLCAATVRKFVVPVPWQKDPPQIVQKYMSSTWRRDNMTLLDFLRKSGNNGQISQRYRRMHSTRKIGMPLEDWINVHPADGKTLVASVMYTHTNDRHYGQWLLLNVPFRNIDDLWHPEADKLPRNLKYLGLCVLHRRRFWRDPRRIRAELEKEARSEMYMQNTLAMLAARIELIDAYLSGETTVDTEPAPALDGIAQVAGSAIQVAPEQAAIINSIGQRVQQALHMKWPEDAEVDAWGAWLEKEGPANVPTVVLGPAGSGKSTAVEIALDRAVQNGAHVGVACPTGMLATRYRARHPDLDIDTVHGMFALHKDELATAEIMKIYDLIVIDEIGQLAVWIFDRLLRLWDAADRRPAIVFVGDFCQLTGADGTTARDSPRWSQMSILQLHEMRRCKCARLKWKLQLLRSTMPSGAELKKILKGHRANLPARHACQNPFDADDVAVILRDTPNTTFLTVSRKGAAKLNQYALQALFPDADLLDCIPCDPQENFDNFRGTAQVDARPFWMPIYEGMRVTITRNTDKENGFVNGMGAVVQRRRHNGVQVKTDEGKVLLIHPIGQECCLWDGSYRKTTTYPLRLGYSTTLHKIQGATLPHITIWMDVPFVRAALYVALSRVQHDRDWRFVGSIKRRHCMPAAM